MKIPLLDLKRQYPSIRAEIQRGVAAVLEEQAFVLGKRVPELRDDEVDAVVAAIEEFFRG